MKQQKRANRYSKPVSSFFYRFITNSAHFRFTESQTLCVCPPIYLFPLHRPRRLRRNIINHPTNLRNFARYALGGASQQFMRQRRICASHKIIGMNSTQGNHFIISTRIALYPDGHCIGNNGEVLGGDLVLRE